MVNVFILIAAAVLLANAVAQNSESFKAWKEREEKSYPDAKAEAKAEKNYNENVAKIEKHNKKKKSTYEQVANMNADLSDEDLKNVRRSSQVENVAQPESSSKNNKFAKRVKSDGFTKSSEEPKTNGKSNKKVKATMPASVDYSSVIGQAKNQGKCGASWAFSIVSTLEYWNHFNQTARRYSEQCLIDCVMKNKGCNGGSFDFGYAFVIEKGITFEQNYPLNGTRNTCMKHAKNYLLQNACYTDLKGDEAMLKVILHRYGPMSVYLATAGTGIDAYKSGVFYNEKCSSDPKLADQAFTLVGYGTDKDLGDFWTLRYSLGKNYGENGNIRIARNKNNQCGVANAIYGPCPF